MAEQLLRVLHRVSWKELLLLQTASQHSNWAGREGQSSVTEGTAAHMAFFCTIYHSHRPSVRSNGRLRHCGVCCRVCVLKCPARLMLQHIQRHDAAVGNNWLRINAELTQ
jgi:hypothetical protein